MLTSLSTSIQYLAIGFPILRNLFDTSTGELGIQLGYGTDGRIGVAIGSGISRRQGAGSYTPGDTDSTIVATLGESLSGDFNGDGKTDLISVQGGQLLLYTGDGAGNITHATTKLLAGFASSIATGDFNGDGITDVVVTTGTQINRYLGNTSGTFSSALLVGSGTGIRGVDVGDFNGDGKDDVIFASTNQVNIGLGWGDGTFQASQGYSISGVFIHLDTGDFNGDGKLDVAIGQSGGASVTTLLGNGRGALSYGTSITTLGNLSVNTQTLVVEDLNHDGLSDFVARTGNGVDLYLATSGGTFTSSNIASAATYSAIRDVHVADLNNDGDLDVMFGNGSGLTAAYVAYGAGDGTFRTIVDTGNTLTNDYLTTIGDFNGDGVLDFIAGDNFGFVFQVNIQGTAQTATVQRFDLTSVSGARSSLSLLDQILERLAKENGIIGSNQSRLLSALNTIQATRENYLAASSRLADTDIAGETARLTRLQILQQSASSILAQANQAPALALTLLQ